MKSVIGTLALALAGAVAAPAFAADAPAAPASAARGPVAEACHDDVQKLCPDGKPGNGCLKEHRRELSKACKKALMEARKARKGGGA